MNQRQRSSQLEWSLTSNRRSPSGTLCARPIVRRREIRARIVTRSRFIACSAKGRENKRRGRHRHGRGRRAPTDGQRSPAGRQPADVALWRRTAASLARVHLVDQAAQAQDAVGGGHRRDDSPGKRANAPGHLAALGRRRLARLLSQHCSRSSRRFRPDAWPAGASCR